MSIREVRQSLGIIHRLLAGAAGKIVVMIVIRKLNLKKLSSIKEDLSLCSAAIEELESGLK